MTSICYILSYHVPDYVRTRTIICALENINMVKLYQARNTSKGMIRYCETLWKLIAIRLLKNPDFYILGFRGYELFWPVRIITFGKQLIYDHMMSPYDSLINERKSLKKGGVMEKLIYLYEKSILHNADTILTDTDIHKSYFQEKFNIDSHKILDIPVGTDEELFNTTRNTPFSASSGLFEILFYGTFLPLHGVDIIVDAASRIQHLPIHFTLIGGDRTNQYYKLIKQAALNNVTHIEWVNFEQLPQLISSTNLGLGGPFGNTGQAHRVITGKTFQFLAMAKPVIIGTITSEYGFEDKVNCIMIRQGDGKALADAITWAFDHHDQIKKIGTQGFKLYQDRYAIKQITEKMKGIFT